MGQNLASLAEGAVLLIVVRLLGKAEVGVLGSIMLIYQTVALICTAGFPAALMYFLPARPIVERRAIAWRFAASMLGLGVCASLALLLIASVDHFFPGVLTSVGSGSGDAPSLKYLYVMALYPLADVPSRMLNNLLVSERRAQSVTLVSTIRAAGQTLFTLTPIALGLNLWMVVGSITAFGYLYGSVLLYSLRRIYRGVERQPSPISGRELIRFAFPLGVTVIVSLLNSRLDQYLILISYPAAQFAEYQAGAWQVPLVTGLVYPVGAAFMPRWRELFVQGNNAEAIAVWRNTAIKVSLLVVPICMVLVVAAEETMEVLFTSSYVNAAWVFRWYAVWTMGRVATFGNVITAAGAPRKVLHAALIAVGCNVLISPPLLWLLGFEGPALGTVIAFVPEVLAYCWFISQAAGVPLRRTFPLADYFKTVLVAAIAALPALALKRYWFAPAGLKLGAITLIVVLGFALLGSITRRIQSEDWSYVRSWLRRQR